MIRETGTAGPLLCLALAGRALPVVRRTGSRKSSRGSGVTAASLTVNDASSGSCWALFASVEAISSTSSSNRSSAKPGRRVSSCFARLGFESAARPGAGLFVGLGDLWISGAPCETAGVSTPPFFSGPFSGCVTRAGRGIIHPLWARLSKPAQHRLRNETSRPPRRFLDIQNFPKSLNDVLTFSACPQAAANTLKGSLNTRALSARARETNVSRAASARATARLVGAEMVTSAGARAITAFSTSS